MHPLKARCCQPLLATDMYNLTKLSRWASPAFDIAHFRIHFRLALVQLVILEHFVGVIRRRFPLQASCPQRKCGCFLLGAGSSSPEHSARLQGTMYPLRCQSLQSSHCCVIVNVLALLYTSTVDILAFIMHTLSTVL